MNSPRNYTQQDPSDMGSRSCSQAVRRIKASSKPTGLHGSLDVSNNITEGEVVLQNIKEKDNYSVNGGRERLKRHREEVAGRLLIPDRWGQEEMLKDWIDCSAFEALLVPNKIASARKALVADHGRAASGVSTSSSPHQQRLSIESRC
ncbi:protein BIC2-like [Mangifera indica]|uniref:protein BIC2-like n=1 Tax=Mangifera indica TaxID=29780 RepID=UPI001CFACFE0|nr:protein BIC2-like [Mangifera indica]